VDPDGRILKISITKKNLEFVNSVENDLKRISPAATVDRKTGIVSLDSSVDVTGYEKGTELLSYLINEQVRDTIITESETNSCIPTVGVISGSEAATLRGSYDGE